MLCSNGSSAYFNRSNNCSLHTDDNVTETVNVDWAGQRLQESFNMAQYAICPLLFAVGIAGNTLTIITVSKPQFRQLTSRYILCALAIADSLLLCTNPFNQQFMWSLFSQDVRALTRYGCKIFFVAYRTGKISASWCVVLVAIERFVAVLFPLKVRTIVTKRTIGVAITTVFILMFTLSVAWCFSSDVVHDVCVPDATTPENVALHKKFVVAGAACYSIVPVLILCTITPPVIIKLVRHRHRQRGLHSNIMSRFARETTRTTIMLTTIVLVYIVCVTPITLSLVLTFWTNEPIFGSQKKEFIILTAVAQSFEQINHSMNFTIYILFSRQFRLAFLKMIYCHRRERYKSRFSSPVPVYTTQSIPLQSDDNNESLGNNENAIFELY